MVAKAGKGIIDYFIGPPKPKPDVSGVVTASKLLEDLGTSDDNVTLNALVKKNLKTQQLQEVKDLRKKQGLEGLLKGKGDEDFIDIFQDILNQDLSLDVNKVPNSFKRINPDTNSVEIRVGDNYYPPEVVQEARTPSGQKIYKLLVKEPSSAGDFMNLGVKLSNTPEIQRIMNAYIEGKLNKGNTAYALTQLKGIPNFVTTGSTKSTTLYEVQRPGQRFDPFLQGYISTLKEVPEVIQFKKFLEENPDIIKNKDVNLIKLNEAKGIIERLSNDKFNNIKFPDGTLMKDQPINIRMYNSFMSEPSLVTKRLSSERGSIDASEYSKYLRKYIIPYYKFKNPEADFIPDFKKPTKSGKLNGTDLVYDTRKGKRTYVITDEYKPYFNIIKEKMYSFVPQGERSPLGATFKSHLSRMIGYAKEQGTDPDEIIKVIESIDAEGFANLFMRKKALEENVKNLREQSLSSSLKRTNPELFVDKQRKVGDFDIGLIELSHIEDVFDNWRAAFDLNNIFLAPGKFNREQRNIDTKMKSLLKKFSKAKSFSEKKSILQDIKRVENKLIEKNLISKYGDRYFGVDKDSAIEANLLKKVEEAVDFTRYLADGGLVSFEEVLEYNNG